MGKASATFLRHFSPLDGGCLAVCLHFRLCDRGLEPLHDTRGRHQPGPPAQAPSDGNCKCSWRVRRTETRRREGGSESYRSGGRERQEKTRKGGGHIETRNGSK